MTVPTVSITAPANGATVSGTAVTVSASAADNVGVAGVQFMLDGANLGAEDTTSPYRIAWNTTTATNAGPFADRDRPRRRRQHGVGGDLGHGGQQRRHHGADHHLEDAGAECHRRQHGDHRPRDLQRSDERRDHHRHVRSSLRNAGGTTVGATVGYDTGTLVATLTPSSALAAGQTYTATITGGSAGVKDAAGNALAGRLRLVVHDRGRIAAGLADQHLGRVGDARELCDRATRARSSSG